MHWWQRTHIGTVSKEKAYFTGSNCVSHSTWNSRQETRGLFKKQFQTNYDLKSMLTELWWKANTLFLWDFLLPHFSYFWKRILEWNQPSFKKKAYQFSFISFSFFSSLMFEHLKGQFLSHVSYSKFVPFQVVGDFCVLEDFFFLKMLLCKTEIVFCSDGFLHCFNDQNFTLMWDHLDSLTTL